MSKASLPQGTRDFAGIALQKRRYILNTISAIFEKYGFQPLETPAMENLDTLMGKYGEEGDKLIFKVLNNGLSNEKNIDKARAGFESLLQGRHNTQLTERALRYDLTIPFARFVAMNHGSLSFPFKRYQIQPVWRADRPQKGRYREFTQCDADVVGSKSLLNEVELVHMVHEAFCSLRLPGYSLQVNSRKLLAALAEACGGAGLLVHITTAIDKLDKIGLQKVQEELRQRGLQQAQVDTISQYLAIAGTNSQKMEQLQAFFGSSTLAQEGLQELAYIINKTAGTNLELTPTLARGLSYYTGAIFEGRAPKEVAIGSIAGGGRYDNLTGLFGVPDVTGVGISFGVDRIVDVLEELQLFPTTLASGPKVLFFNMGSAEADYAFDWLQQLRKAGVSGELYHETARMDKQFKYAEKKNIPFVAIAGEAEVAQGVVNLKELATGVQQAVTQEELLARLRS